MLTPSAYINRILRAWIVRLWWTILVPFAFIAYGLATDWRISVVGFMLLLIVYPMAATFAILSCATRPDVARRTRANRVLIDNSLDKIELIQEIFDDDGAPVSTEILETACIMSVETSARTITVRVGQAIPDFILLPCNAVEPNILAALLERHALRVVEM